MSVAIPDTISLLTLIEYLLETCDTLWDHRGLSGI